MLLKHLALLVALSGTVAVSAQKPAVGRADQPSDVRELRACTLNLDLVTRAVVAMHEISSLPVSEVDLNATNGDDQRQTVENLARIISRSSKAKAIAAGHGFSPHALALTSLTIIQTGIAAFALDTGAKMSDVLADGPVNAANIAVYHAHKDQIDALLQKYPPKPR